ncbi:MAG: DNA translocase FtsK 4TM domain-containing protein, partial [Rhodospirillales bacterium]|nr:DNA translocase FtsK 4TM domain-containing protein [Rhodospirillales bacterium]
MAFLPEMLVIGLRRRLVEGVGLVALVMAVGLLAALFTYAPSDPSWNTASNTEVANLVARTGAGLADFLLQGLGAAAFLPAIILMVWAWRLVTHKGVKGIWLRLLAVLAGVGLSAIAVAALPAPAAWVPRTGLGGAVGWIMLPLLGGYISLLGPLLGLGEINFAIPLTASLAGLLAGAALIYGSGLGRADWLIIWGLLRRSLYIFRPPKQGSIFDPGELDDADELDDEQAKPVRRRKSAKPAKEKKAPIFESKKSTAKVGKRAKDARQGSLHLDIADTYQLPPLDLLEAPPIQATQPGQDKEALGRNAKLLETVLEDFGVRGEIVKVRPGPVVTLYELEPAPGIKTSRVVGLSDDIARSMSALSVRMAVVPGRSVIGIELPNEDREIVNFRELLASRAFERDKGALTLALGKDIGGASSLVDLAAMPHLLIAGTTGSGKSVAVNTMILSLLYR